MELPLTREAFRHALKMGYGRAVLHLRTYPELTYDEDILYALTHNQSYDLQVEGTRLAYLLLVMHAAHRWPQMRSVLIEAMLQSKDSRDVCSMLDLVNFLAQTGDSEAREALYEKLRRFETDEPAAPLSEIFELDGFEGLKRGAGIIGEAIAARGATEFQRIDCRMFEHRGLDSTKVSAWLRSLQSDDPVLRVFEIPEIKPVFESDTQDKAYRHARLSQVLRMSYSEFLREPELGIPYTRRWSEAATEDDLLLAAKDLIGSRDINQTKLLLIIFSMRPFPLNPAPMILMAESEDFMLRHRAFAALENVRHESVRQLFMKSIENGVPRFGLLRSNLREGDDELVEKTLDHPRVRMLEESDLCQFHWMGHDLLDLCDRGVFKQLSPIAHWIYEYSPCTLCRSRAVTHLIQCGGVSDDQLNECRFDSYSYTRVMAIKALAERGPS